MGIKWTDLSLAQKSLIENGPVEPAQPRAQILRGRPRLERDEQRLFANWCLLNALPFCWHATHKASTATRGVFDFWVGSLPGRSAWIEFKQPGGKLRLEQETFRAQLAAHGLSWHVVESAAQAIAIVKSWSSQQAVTITEAQR